MEDSAPAFVRMRNGTSVQIEVSWVAHQKKDDAHGVEIFGTEAVRAHPPWKSTGWTRTSPIQ